MVIYGVAFLAGCMIAGLFLGELLGSLIGVQANVGGVGIAMLVMILLSDRLRRTGHLTPLTEQGVLFWSAIYIPIVVAMAAKQNVLAAVRGGPAAILAGAGAVALCLALVPLLSRLGGDIPSAEGGMGGSQQKDPASSALPTAGDPARVVRGEMFSTTPAPPAKEPTTPAPPAKEPTTAPDLPGEDLT